MKVQFTKIERTAGVFLLGAIGAFVVFSIVVAIKQGWFSQRHHFSTTFTHGDGLHPGTIVQIAGLRAGTVERVYLNDDNRIQVEVSVLHEFVKRVRKDSVAKMLRPFVIGDKIVDISIGSPTADQLEDGMAIAGEDTMDLMDLVGGGKLGPYLATLDGLLRNLQTVVEAFTDPKRSQALISMFDEALPTIQGVRELTKQMTKNKELDKAIVNISKMTKDVNTMLPEMLAFSKNLPELGDSMTKTMLQLATLTTELNKFMPLFTQIMPVLPEASQKGVEALREAVIVLKAMERSFLLRGSVQDIYAEDEKKRLEIEKMKNASTKEKDSDKNQGEAVAPTRMPAGEQ